jgi:Na+/H+ antiporter NhaD/arsenite permease-like protein
MTATIALLFVLTYVAIALEHPLGVNKSAAALLGAGVLWTLFALGAADAQLLNTQLAESVLGTAQIVFFLIGAMTIVEVIDAHNGFEVLTRHISTTRLSVLMWMIGLATFFLSAILDNLTTAIVMVSLVKRLLDVREDRLLFAGIIVIAANAGGAWTPIGDVTTTMLWIGGQITSLAVMQGVFLASIVNLLVPLTAAAWMAAGRPVLAPPPSQGAGAGTTVAEQTVVLGLGLGVLVLVPVFKAVTHLPPFMGILLGLGVLWLVGDLMHRGKDEADKQNLTLASALGRIDMSAIVFFIGILLAVAVLEHTHILSSVAQWMDQHIGRQDLIVLIIGIVSAVVDNVPLVAASMGMYDLARYPPDSFLWEFMAYCAGTGGSILIIGSAAGVAAMGLERIDFLWYLRKISALALAGYLAGAAVYVLQFHGMH